jgi:hypothetical protein
MSDRQGAAHQSRDRGGHIMRRFTTGIGTIIAVVALASVALALTSTALAKKPDNPGKPTTTTTTVPQSTALEACEDSANATLVGDGLIELTIPGTAQTSFECLWTPDQAVGTTTATVTVTEIGGAVKGLPTVFVRDDSPGEICLLESDWGGAQEPPYTASFDLAYGTDLPGGYEAWEGTTYWDLVYDQEGLPTVPVVGAYWCAPQDPILDSLRADTNGTPLHFMASFNARSGGHIVVELTP